MCNQSPITPLISRILLNSFEPEAMEGCLQQTTLEHTILTKGHFTGKLLQAAVDDICINRGCYSQAVIASGQLNNDRVTLGFIIRSNDSCSFNTQYIQQGGMLVLSENQELHTHLTAESDWLNIQIKRELFENIGIELPNNMWSLPPQDNQSSIKLAQTLLPLLKHLEGQNDNNFHIKTLNIIQDTLISTLSNRAFSLQPATLTKSFLRSENHLNIIRNVENYIETFIDKPITVTDLCIKTGYPIHTLERVFKKHHGVSPIQYINYKRLTAFRKLLLKHTPDELSVTQAALCCGLIHFGRTAKTYKSVFRELPFDTLKNRKPTIASYYSCRNSS